jgi:neutral trehalase
LQDWQENLTSSVRRPEIQQFCRDLNSRWKMLGRRAVPGGGERSSLLLLPCPGVVPGGRFHKVYY